MMFRFTDHIKYLTVRINDSTDSDAYSHFSDVVDFIGMYLDLNICDRACKNQPCERKKLPIFSVFAVS